jgi:hypothetical protein
MMLPAGPLSATALFSLLSSNESLHPFSLWEERYQHKKKAHSDNRAGEHLLTPKSRSGVWTKMVQPPKTNKTKNTPTPTMVTPCLILNFQPLCAC